MEICTLGGGDGVGDGGWKLEDALVVFLVLFREVLPELTKLIRSDIGQSGPPAVIVLLHFPSVVSVD